VDRHSALQRWIYGSGDFGFSLTYTIVDAYFAIFLTDLVGIKPAVAAAAIFIGRSSDYLNDPLAGYLSDRTRTRWGRRRPFLLFGALPFALAFTLMWWRPPVANDGLLVIYYAVAYVLFDLGATFTSLPYYALTPELTDDYDERTALTAARMFFSIFASLVAFTIPLLIVGSFRPENADRVLAMGALFGFVAALPLWLVFARTRERADFMDQPQPGFRHSVKAALDNRPFLFSVGIYLFTWLSVSILEVMLLYFVKYVAQREAQSNLIMATIFIVAIAALPFWQWTSQHLNKRKAYMVGIAFWAVVQLALVSIGPLTPMSVVLGLCVLSGIGVSAAHVLPWSMIPDAVEYGEWKTGERHEGVFYSLVTLVQKVCTSIAIPLALLALDRGGYVPNSVVQPPAAVTAIRVVAGAVPAVLLCAGILFAWRYPLDRENYTEIAAELAARRQAALGQGRRSSK
jgi:GPH family glycoside/pentoside/hexuronide:cation symporter